MSFAVLVILVLCSGLAFFAALARRLELRRMKGRVKARELAEEHGAATGISNSNIRSRRSIEHRCGGNTNASPSARSSLTRAAVRCASAGSAAISGAVGGGLSLKL